MMGSRGWLKRRRHQSEWYWRRYGYAAEETLRRWRRIHQLTKQLYREAIADCMRESEGQ